MSRIRFLFETGEASRVPIDLVGPTMQWEAVAGDHPGSDKLVSFLERFAVIEGEITPDDPSGVQRARKILRELELRYSMQDVEIDEPDEGVIY